MLINVSPPAKKDFESHAELSQKYGVKAAGLAFLPPAWRPDFAAISILPNRTWKAGDLTSSKLEIATRTAKIANKLGEDAQIMWFCNIPLAYQVKRNLPWFRSREKFDPAPRQEFQYKPFVVSKPDDLKFLSDEKVTIRLSPEANLIRDDPNPDRPRHSEQTTPAPPPPWP